MRLGPRCFQTAACFGVRLWLCLQQSVTPTKHHEDHGRLVEKGPPTDQGELADFDAFTRAVGVLLDQVDIRCRAITEKHCESARKQEKKKSV